MPMWRPGQNQTFWTSRVGMFTDKVRSALLELDGAATAAGAPVSEAIATLDRLGKSEQRARNYIDLGTDAARRRRDLHRGARSPRRHARAGRARTRRGRAGRRHAPGGASARAVDARARRRRNPRARRARAGAARSRAGIRADSQRRPRRNPPRAATTTAAGQRPDAEYARVISKAPVPAGAPAATPGDSAVECDRRNRRRPARPRRRCGRVRSRRRPPRSASASAGKTPAPPAQPTPAAPPAGTGTSPIPLAEAAAVCVDLARLSDSGEISKLLERAAAVLNASGIVVWMASENRAELFPAAAAGYDDRLFSRIGSIPRDASNLTAAAFRDGALAHQPECGLVSRRRSPFRW